MSYKSWSILQGIQTSSLVLIWTCLDTAHLGARLIQPETTEAWVTAAHSRRKHRFEHPIRSCLKFLHTEGKKSSWACKRKPNKLEKLMVDWACQTFIPKKKEDNKINYCLPLPSEYWTSALRKKKQQVFSCSKNKCNFFLIARSDI